MCAHSTEWIETEDQIGKKIRLNQKFVSNQ